MRLGELLVAQGLCTPEQVAVAVDRQQREGGRLGNHLVATGVLTVQELLTLLRSQQEAESACRLCEHGLKQSQLFYGPEHATTHRAEFNLARALLAAGRVADAVPHAELAWSGLRNALGTEHHWTREAAQLAANGRHIMARLEEPAGAV